jgi:hypothetical protein
MLCRLTWEKGGTASKIAWIYKITGENQNRADIPAGLQFTACSQP